MAEVDKRRGSSADRDVEDTSKKIPYPKSVFFILTTEFCERFSYYGMRAVLTLYLKNVLKFSEDTSTVIYHAFTMFAYFTPLFGAMIADSLLGKFRTIFYLSVVYVVGNIILSLGATPPLNLPAVAFSMIGLVLIAIGTGGIKPCVSAFGGDQFQLPQQEVQLAGFFSIFYAAINSGSLISTFITPIFRKDISCFGDNTCYPLAFGVPAVLMFVALVIFLIGRFMYRIREPTGNVVVAVGKTIGHAISRKRKSKETKEHWLDYADDKYGKREIADIKILLSILLLYIPLPLFWSLFDQQGSRWTFQASRMDGDLGGFIIKPDQMQVVNPVLILAFIPMFNNGIYPLLAKCNLLKKPLQRLVVGGIFAGLSFVISGIVEIQLQDTYPAELGSTDAYLNLVNMANTSATGKLFANGIEGLPFDLTQNSNFLAGIVKSGTYELRLNFSADKEDDQTLEFKLADEQAATLLLVTGDQNRFKLLIPADTIEKPETNVGDQLEKSGEGIPFISILQSGLWEDPGKGLGGKWDDEIVQRNLLWEVKIKDKKANNAQIWTFSENQTIYSDYLTAPAIEVDPKEWRVYIEKITKNAEGKETNRTKHELLGQNIDLLPGGNYVLTIVKTGPEDFDFTTHLSVIVAPNTFHMLWLLPQYIVMTMGEIMFSITIMDFSYTEAPKSMKSVMQSAWLMTVMVGNAIDIIIVELKFFDKQWKEFFLFAGLMFVDMAIFSILAHRYKAADLSKSTDFAADDDVDEDEDADKNKAIKDGDNNDDNGRDNSAFENENDKDQ